MSCLTCLGLRGVIQESPPPTYEEITTATYAATRFPGTFAAIVRVFDELKSRLPDFKPKSMLDFGAGPGTAIWAAQEVEIKLHNNGRRQIGLPKARLSDVSEY